MLSTSFNQSWLQLHVLFILVGFVTLELIYFSSIGAELIKSNHGRYDLQFTSTAGPTQEDKIQDHGHVPVESSSSSEFNSKLLLQTLFAFTFHPPTRDAPSTTNSSNENRNKQIFLRDLTAFSNFNPPLSKPPMTSRVKRFSPQTDYQEETGQSKAMTPRQTVLQTHHHRFRHQHKLNKAIMNTNKSSNDGGGFNSVGTCGFGDCVNNSSKRKPEKTALLHTSQEECYHTGDVLIVVAITCLLNFSFVLVLWASVSWINYRPNKTSSWWKKNKHRDQGRMFANKKRKWDEEKNRCWEDTSRSESSSTEEDEGYDDEGDDNSQDNLIVKSYSMEDLRFYRG